MTDGWQCGGGWKNCLEADSVEFCTVPGWEDVFACASYHLVESERIRVGGITLYQEPQEGAESENAGEGRVAKVLAEHKGAGVLDSRWNGRSLATADADGAITLLSLTGSGEGEQRTATLEVASKYESEVPDSEAEHLGLAVDWFLGEEGQVTDLLASYSSGRIAVLDAAADLTPSLEGVAHPAEVWAAATSKHNTSCFYTGGDDCKLKVWDRRAGMAAPSAVAGRNAYMMGVTCIQQSPYDANYMCVGSYDDTLRMWDLRSMRSEVSSTAVGGGVWRIKWHPDSSHWILAACMYNGYALLHADDDWATSVVRTYQGPHGDNSLAYGVDWSRQRRASDCATATSLRAHGAACSFYDSQCSLWEISASL